MDKIDEKYYLNVADLMENNTPIVLPRPTIKIIHYPSGEDPWT